MPKQDIYFWEITESTRAPGVKANGLEVYSRMNVKISPSKIALIPTGLGFVAGL